MTCGIAYDIINEPPAFGAERDPATGQYKPVAFMPFRLNGQYIMEGITGGMMYSLGGERLHAAACCMLLVCAVCVLCVASHMFVCTGRLHSSLLFNNTQPQSQNAALCRSPRRPPHPPGLGLILLDLAHRRRSMETKYRKLLLGM